MNWFTRVWSSSIGKKVLVAVTGLVLVGFLVTHLLGNLQIYLGADALNRYSKGLHDLGPLLVIAELGIIAAFVVHVGLVIKLTLQNRKARGSSYGMHVSKKPTLSYTASKTMALSGLIVLAFLVVHILDYRLNRGIAESALAACMANGTECGDTAGAQVIAKLLVPWRAVLYTIGSLLIGWHLFHGIQSSARSLGIASTKWTPIIEKAGATIGIVLGLLFATIPVTIYATSGSFGKVDELATSMAGDGHEAAAAPVDNGVVVHEITPQEELQVDVVRTRTAEEVQRDAERAAAEAANAEEAAANAVGDATAEGADAADEAAAAE